MMKRKNKQALEEISKKLMEIYNDESKQEVRVGDANTELSFDMVTEDVENRIVTIQWTDGKITKAVADSEDEYDFATGFGLCIAKKFVNNLANYADAVKRSKRYTKKNKEE